MLTGYQTYIPVDSWGVVFKKNSSGEYQGYIILTRSQKAVILPCDEGMYLGLHRALEKAAEAFKVMENGEHGDVYISAGFES